MIKLGIGVRELGHSQLAYQLIRSGNEVGNGVDDLVAFFLNPAAPCLTPHFATMHLAEAYSFTGVLVATCLDTAARFARIPADRRLFYVWDLEWVREPRLPFDELRSAYAHPGHRLVARSDEHARLLESCWNVPVYGVVPDFDVAALARLGAAQ